MTNKITKDFLKFCCKYAKEYIYDGEYRDGEDFIISYGKNRPISSIFAISTLHLTPDLIADHEVMIRDLIQRARQGLDDSYLKAITEWDKDSLLPNSFIEKEFYIMFYYNAVKELHVANYNNSIEAAFYFKNYQENDIFTIEEQAIIDAIHFIMENQK